MPRFLRLPLLLLAAAALAVAGCDSNDAAGDGAAATTVQFETSSLSLLESESPTLELPVTISNPQGQEVTVEVLFAAAASRGGTLADLGINEAAPEGAFYGDDDSLNAYVTETLTFDADAEDGATQTVSFDITDDEVEGEETIVLALQNARSTAGGDAVSVGDPGSLTATIEAEGTITFLSEDFSDNDVSPFSQFSVSSSINWVTSSGGDADNVPYAYMNGFNAGDPSDDWLISPAFDFTTTTGETLTFLNAQNYNGPALMVKVSTDYSGSGTPENATWTDVTDQVTLSEGGFEFVDSGDVDLSSFEGENVHVAFHYVSPANGGAAWEVDDVVISGLGAAGGDDDGSDE